MYTDDKDVVSTASEEYELTYIGDLPYLRLKAVRGKLLEGADLRREQELYEKAVAERHQLDMVTRIKMQGHHLLSIHDFPEKALTDQYTLRATRFESGNNELVQVLEATPHPFTPEPDSCQWKYTFWVSLKTSRLLHYRSDTTDTTDLCRGAHGEEWYQTIDGLPRILHSEWHYFYMRSKHRFTLDAEDNYVDYRRFRATVKMGEARELPDENSPTTPPEAPKQ